MNLEEQPKKIRAEISEKSATPWDEMSDGDIAERLAPNGKVEYGTVRGLLKEMEGNDPLMLRLCDLIKLRKFNIPLNWVAEHSSISVKMEIIKRLKEEMSMQKLGWEEETGKSLSIESIKEDIAKSMFQRGDFNTNFAIT